MANSKNYRKNSKKEVAAFVGPPSTGWANRRMNGIKSALLDPMVKAKLDSQELLTHVHSMNKSFKRNFETSSSMDKALTTGLIISIGANIMKRKPEEFSFILKEKVCSETTGAEKFVTNFTTGRPSTQSLATLAKIKGTTNKVLFDTIKNLKSGRKDLQVNFGFNQKRYCFLRHNAYVTTNDYLQAFGMSGKEYKYPVNDDQVAYGCAVKETSQLKILNSDKYLDTRFKIHLIEMVDEDLGINDLAELTFSSNTKNVKINETGKIPNRYQLSDLTGKSSNAQMRNVLCLKRTRLEMSSAFIQNANIVRTFKQKLPAGAIWEFNLTVYCGSGPRLDQVYYNAKLGDGVQPSQFGLIIEAAGVDCQGIHIGDKGADDIYTGTSPGWFNVEFKKSLELVNDNTSFDPVGGFSSSKFAIRFFDNDVSTDVDFNVPAEDIEGDAASFYIPILTSKEEKHAGQR